MAEERDLKYINRDFSDFRTQLTEYAKNYFPETYNDFSPTSPGMMFIEMAAYVGDVLSFYQDTQLQETYLTHAKDPKNLYSLAYMMGYRPKTTGVSEVEVQISQIIGTVAGGEPNWDQAAIIPANSIVVASDRGNTNFIIPKPIDMSYSSSYDPTFVSVYEVAAGQPTEYLIRKTTNAFSGEKKTTSFTISSAEKFKTLTLQDSNIIGIESIVDSDGNNWYEVPYLGQDTLFVDEGASQPYTLKVQKVPRRFVTRFQSSGYLQIQFGAGTNSSDDEVILPDPSNVGLGTDQGINRMDYAYDPTNFLYSKSYGIAPSNTTLTVTYLKGGGISANSPANSITTFSGNNSIVAAGGDTSRLGNTFLTVNNPRPATGGRGADTVDELRENSLRAFNEQNRAVTLQDYAVRALSLPSKYGSIAKVYVTQDSATNSNLNERSLTENNPLALSLYVLAYNDDGKLTTAGTLLKNNLRSYLSQYMLITDAINIKDAFVVNIGVNYDIIVRPDYSGRDVLLSCNLKLRELFSIKKWSINQPINLSDIYAELDTVKGVQTVQSVHVTNLAGGAYASHAYDTKGATRNNIVYPSYDPCIFEVKYPEQDIKGRITVL